MPEIRPDLDVLARFVESRLIGNVCLYSELGLSRWIPCGGGFWISEYGTLVCDNHKQNKYCKDPAWVKVELR